MSSRGGGFPAGFGNGGGRFEGDINPEDLFNMFFGGGGGFGQGANGEVDKIPLLACTYKDAHTMTQCLHLAVPEDSKRNTHDHAGVQHSRTKNLIPSSPSYLLSSSSSLRSFPCCLLSSVKKQIHRTLLNHLQTIISVVLRS